MSEKTEGYFHQVLVMTDDDARQSAAKLAERQIKRQLMSAHDSAEQQVITAQNDIEREYMKLRKPVVGRELDVNAILGHRLKIRELKQAQNAIESEYQFLFAEDIPVI